MTAYRGRKFRVKEEKGAFPPFHWLAKKRPSGQGKFILLAKGLKSNIYDLTTPRLKIRSTYISITHVFF